MKKILCVILAAVSVFSLSVTAFADVDYASGITREMCKAGYWKNLTFTDKDEVLMTPEEIDAYNENAVASHGTYVVGIKDMSETYNADYQRSVLTFNIPTRALYINGTKIDNTAYYTKINEAIQATGYTETVKETEYAVVVRQTDMKFIPTLDAIGYSATDPDDEMEYENLCVNEPFVIRGMCIIDGTKFYYGWSTDCVGWVPADDIAVCASKDEWLDAWYNETDAKDFIVVTQDKLTLEPSLNDADLSGLKLTLGTTLKLVPDDEKPALIDHRNTWHNYVVYIPVRNEDGSYSKKAALIPDHYSISTGYLPFTQSNLLDVAFSCLGNRYGWAGMLDSYDCSLYTRTIYRCFGLTYPRNSTWQQNVSGTAIDITAMTDEQKQELIETMPSGTTMFFPGHTMMYVGTENSVSYVISALGTVVDSDSTAVQTVYNISLTPLTVKRGASYGYTTWLHNLNAVLMVMPARDISGCEITATAGENGGNITVSVTEGGKTLYEDVNYTVTVEDGNAVITGINNYTGTLTVTPEMPQPDTKDDDTATDSGNTETQKSFFARIKDFFSSIAEWFRTLFGFVC